MTLPAQHVVLDVETTGFSPRRGDRIIEIGAVTIRGRDVVDQFSSLIDTGRSIHPQAQQIHGISEDMLSGQPKPDEVWPEFQNFIGDSTLIAHNAPFDIGFLKHEYALLGMHLNNRYLCTLRMSRSLYPFAPNYKLRTLGRYLFRDAIDQIESHRALDDAKLAAMIFLEIQRSEHK